jgi:hypothetical protein
MKLDLGLLLMELREWPGSLALMAVNDIHKKPARESIGNGDR